eukprot:722209-Pyramimonas_sp.AAC.1
MGDEGKFKKKYKQRSRPVVNKKDRRCQHVKKVAETKGKNTRIGGLWVTMDMQKRGQEGALHAVLHLGEMMNGECAGYKEGALRQLKKSRIAVRDYVGGCNCVCHSWKGALFSGGCYLDGFHWKRHKCDAPRFPKKKPTCNSQAAEQFWSKLNKLRLLCAMRRARYIFLLRQFCARRNRFSRSEKRRKDCTPAVSKKRARTGK